MNMAYYQVDGVFAKRVRNMKQLAITIKELISPSALLDLFKPIESATDVNPSLADLAMIFFLFRFPRSVVNMSSTPAQIYWIVFMK